MHRTKFSRKSKDQHTNRIRILRFFFITFAVVIVLRLFSLQVLQASFYDALASGQHDFYQELIPERGSVYVEDWQNDQAYLAATNEALAFVYADPRRVEDPDYTAWVISDALDWDEEEEVQEELDELEGLEVQEVQEEEGQTKQERLAERLSKTDDPYEPVERGVTEEDLQKIMVHDLPGIDYILEDTRAYPETNLGGHLLGFVTKNEEGQSIGQYGLEGYYEDFLAGEGGYLDTQTDPSGSWIGVASRSFEPAVDGGDLYLTIDRTIQYVACKLLREGVERYDADGGSLVILEPETGAVITMCNAPDFDPNDYGQVEDISVYNNDAIFTPYEPGSVFKPLVMAAAIDIGAVSPTTVYEDTGEVDVDEYTIRNSDLKAYGWQTMTEVLEKSLNTGMVYVMREMGQGALRAYVERFHFGTLTGIELDTESSGTIDSLYEYAESYYATASYGQGITTTPLQITAAYAALANGGLLMQPYVVKEMAEDGEVVMATVPSPVEHVVSQKTATTISAMLVSVIENGHAEKAAVEGYYLGGKTGTAQVAKQGSLGYQEDATIATFSGFGPIEDPRFAMTVVLDHPKEIPWAADTSAPIWGDIAEFLLQYLEVAPTR